MSEVYPRLAPLQVKYIQKQIIDQSWNITFLRKFFKLNNLIRNIPEGLLKFDTYKWEKMPPGRIAADIQNVPDAIPGITTESVDIIHLVTKIVLPYTTTLRWKNNTIGIGGGNMMQQVVSQQMKPMYQQVEQLIARGDDMKDSVYKDPFIGQGKFKGLFNGGATFAAGLGADNDVAAAGDYIASFVTAKKALKNAAFEKQKYMIVTDLEPEAGAEQGNNLYVTYTPITERRAIMERPDVAGWITSPNYLDNAGTDYKMVVMTPFTSDGYPAVELIQGFNFRTIPLLGGYLNSKAQFETIVVWSGVVKIHFTGAIQDSGTLLNI